MEDQQMVKAFLPHTPQKAFADGIRSWRMIRCFENLNGTRCRHPSEARSKFAISITTSVLAQMAWLLESVRATQGSMGDRVTPAWITRLELSSMMTNACERSKEEIRHLQEVASPDLGCVIVQEGRPLLSSWLGCANLPHILLGSALTHMHAEFQELPTNTLSTQDADSPSPSRLFNAMVSAATFGL